MPTKTVWRNRIVGQGEEDPSQLLANEKNWRIHPKYQQDALSGVLDDVGWVQQIIVNQRTGAVVDGHLRVSLALRRDEATIPVSYVDLDPDEEALIIATLDPLGAMAAVDQAQLDSLLSDIQSDNEQIETLLAGLRSAAPVAGDTSTTDDGRDALTHDHFAPSEISPIEFEEGTAAGRTLDEQWDAYRNATVRQIVLIMSPDEYNTAIDQLDYLNERYQADSNSETVLRLIAEAAEREGWQA